MDLSHSDKINLEKMLTNRFLDDYLKRGGHYIVNNNVNPQQQQQQRCQYQNPRAIIIPNPYQHQHYHHLHHHRVIANDRPLAMNNGSRVIYKNRAGPIRPPCPAVQRVHGGDERAMLPVRAMGGVKEMKKMKKKMNSGFVDLGLLKEEENVPEGIDLSLKLWFK